MIIFKIRHIFLIPIYFLLLLFSKISGISFYYLNHSRIGHMIPDSFVIINELRLKNKLQYPREIYVIKYNTCNKRLSKYFSRILPIYKWPSVFLTINHYMPDFLKLILEKRSGPLTARDAFNVLREYEPIPFPKEELTITRKCLKDNGWNEEPLTTLIVRDRAYLDNSRMNIMKKKFDESWNYHDYRDSDISCYNNLIQEISKESFLARVGKISYKPIKSGDKRFDFTRIIKDECVDYMIASLSKSIITTGTGIDSIGIIYNIPMMYVNILPMAMIYTSSNIYQIPKKLYYLDSGKELNLKDYIRSCYFHSDKYHENGIGIESKAGDELIEYYQEFLNLFLNNSNDQNAFDNLTINERSLVEEFYDLRLSLVPNQKDIAIDQIYKNAFPSPIWLKKLNSNT